ncbi:MAG: ribonuclease HIII [Planctomycetota bacterium]
MSQSTHVIIVPAAERGPLRERLGRGAFEWRKPPHSEFGIKGEGVVVTLYQSGKLVIQGPDPQAFLARYGIADRPDPKAKKKAEREPENDAVAQTLVTTVGSDETGKGDYFGPLVVCAVRVEPEQAEGLASQGVTDSKKVADKKALRLGAMLREVLPCAVVRLDPVDYNQRYPTYSGLNPLLADLHAQAIRELVSPGMRVVVDQFATDSVMRKALGGLDVELVQAPRAERNAAVAAASIVARAEFLLALDEIGEELGQEIPKGAGLQVDEMGAKLVREHGQGVLERVAKMHFKNTDKIYTRLG